MVNHQTIERPYREIVLDDDDVVVWPHEVSDGPGRVQPLLHVEVRGGLVEDEYVGFLQWINSLSDYVTNRLLLDLS